ncbi:MAG: hypothetical protein ACYSWQ_30545, partial [Planctomycetota bacterium]
MVDIIAVLVHPCVMPRTARASAGNICYHVINRGNGGASVFRKPVDYLRFTDMMSQACERLP